MTPRIETGRVIERYIVEGPLGEGGMATVYLLRHRQLDTQFALKVLTTVGVNAELRLMLEGRVQAALRHPNIVAVTDVLDIDGAPGLLMEYVPPPTLAAWLASHHPTLEEAEALFRGIVDGVRHAHRYGLVHRDLKPSNVLLARYDDGVVPKVADFGLAKILGDDPAAGQTRSGLTMGTPQYMAPEQFRDAKKVDRRADIFSLGCILYELLSGRPPYAWSDFIQLYNQIMVQDYAPLPSEVPERLRTAVEACLQPEREARPADCDTVLSLLDGRPMPTNPTVSPENLGRLVEMPLLRDRVGATIPLGPRPPLVPLARADAAAPGDITRVAEVPEPATEVAARVIPGARRAEPPPSVTTLAPRAAPTMVPGDSLSPPENPPAAEPASLAPATALPARGWTPLLAGAAMVAALAVAIKVGVIDPGDAASTVANDPSPAVEVPPVAPVVPEGTTADDPAPDLAGGPAPVPSTPPAAPTPAVREPRPAATTPTPAVVTAAPVVAAPAPATPPLAVVTPVREPEVAAPTRATVGLAGDAERVVATLGSNRFTLPAELEPGTYAILAWFPDMPSTKAGTLVVNAGDRATVKCTSAFLQCTVQK